MTGLGYNQFPRLGKYPYSIMATLPFSTKRTIEAYTTHQKLFLRQWNQRNYTVPPHLQLWLEHIPIGSRLLDLGCGPGQDSRFLRRMGYRVVGIDLTWPYLKTARGRSPRLPLIYGDIRTLPFYPQVFDGIWAAASLIHVPKRNTTVFMRQLLALTKPAGWLAMTVMHGKESGIPDAQWIPGRFLAKWHKPELADMVRRAGWRNVKIRRVYNQERKGSWLNLVAQRPPSRHSPTYM